MVAAGNPCAALELVRDAGDITPYVASTSRLIVSLHCLCGDLEGGEDELEQALEQGRWWHADLWRNLSWFSDLRGRPRFEQLMRRSMELREAALAELVVAPRPIAYVLRQGEPRSVLLLLHGGQSMVRGFSRPWHSIIDDGWLIIAPQSSQQTTSDGVYGWPDRELAREEISASFNAALHKHPDAMGLPVFLGGGSTGGELAIGMALPSDQVASEGFVVVAPCLRDVDALTPPAARLAGSMIVGEWDPWLDRAVELDRRRAAADIDSELELVPRMGHLTLFPPDFGARLVRQLARVRDAKSALEAR